MIRKLLKYVREFKWSTILTPIAMLFEVLLEVLIPTMMANIIDVGIANRDMNYILRYGLYMVLMAVASLICGSASAVLGTYSANGFARNIRNALFNKVESLSAKNIDKFSVPSLVTRLTTDITNVQQAFQMIIRMMARAPLMLIFATIMAIRINPQLSLIVLIAIPVLGVALYFFATKTYPRFQVMLDKYDSMNAAAQENLIAIRVVKAFVRGNYETEKYVKSSTEVRDASRRAEKLLILNSPIMQLTIYTCTILAIWFGGYHILDGSMQTGSLLSFITYLTQILSSLMMLSFVMVGIVMSLASARRITEVLDEDPVIKDGSLDASVVPADGSIRFEDASFSYSGDPDNLTLSHVNLSIASGETIGIIGGSGTGKTSLVQLIPRLYDVISGHVIVGGHDVRDYSVEALRSGVSMVLQKNVLFSGTIRDNLRWGNASATDEQIEAACRAACAHDFIMSFPQGYDTVLGQGGVNVSGGQKQRLCIARALLKNPKVLILDDSTSAVDTATDAAIRKAFREEWAGTTKLIIAQRITSVQEADRIIVLRDGEIDAIGTHEELLRTNQIYQEVYASQQKGVE